MRTYISEFETTDVSNFIRFVRRSKMKCSIHFVLKAKKDACTSNSDKLCFHLTLHVVNLEIIMSIYCRLHAWQNKFPISKKQYNTISVKN